MGGDKHSGDDDKQTDHVGQGSDGHCRKRRRQVITPSPDVLVTELNSAGDFPAEFSPLLHAVPREWFIPDRIWVDRKPIDRVAQPGT